MIGLIYKDFCVLKQQLRFYGLFLLVCFVLMSGGRSMLQALLLMITVMMPMSAFALDEQARFEKYAAATPVGRRGMVAGRYCFAGIMMLVVALVSLLSTMLMLLVSPEKAMGMDAIMQEQLGTLVSLSVSLFINSILLPICFRYGAERARVCYMVVVGGTTGIVVAVLTYFEGRSIPFALDFGAPMILLLLGVMLGVFFASMRFTQRIYQKKEL